MQNVKRVLQIGMYNNLGGIETFLLNYYENINKDKVQFDFINMYDKICFQEELMQAGAKIYNITNVKKNPIKCKNEIVKIIKDNKYEIIHINMLSAANIIPIIAAKSSGARVIIAHSHNANTPKNIIKRFLHNLNKRIILKNSTHYFACSKKAGKWLFGENKKEEITVINNAVDVNRFIFNEEVRKEYRKMEGINDEFVIGHVGRFSEQKNHNFLIDVFQRVYHKNKNSLLILVGVGELEDEIREKVRRLGLDKNVKFLGVRRDVSKLYNVMDVFVLPSLFEGLPIVGIEAQISGLRCIFSNCITSELKLSNKCEFLSLNESMEKWAEVILKASSEYSRAGMSELVESKGYDIKKEAEKLEKFYLDV